MDGTYLVTVQVSDGTDTDSAELVVTLDNVIELTTIDGPSSVDVAENDRGRVATFTASSDADRDGIEWTLSGSDAERFSIDTPSGALRFQFDPISPKLFAEPPDFEAPQDSGADNTYDVTVVATPTGGASTSHAIAVTVTDEDEDGTIALSTTTPRVGQALSASLSDPDTVSGAITWKWERSAGRNAWAAIAAATSSSYVPVAADSGEYLRVTATYDDAHGTGKSVSAALPNVATGPRLDSLSVTTNDSAGGVVWRQMRPAFSPLTLHYSVGCQDTDTMTLTFAAADASSRLAVNATTYANPGAQRSVTATVSVDGQSDVKISVTDETGSETQYVVHCLATDFHKVTSEKSPGATEELLLVPWADYLYILDNNAVPRYRRHLGDHQAQTYFRFYPDGGSGEYRYSYSVAPNSGHVILDENLGEIDRVSTVSPLLTNDSHDFRVLENGNYLLLTYEPASRDFSFLTFNDRNGDPFKTSVSVEDSAIQIVTPMDQALLTWNSYDYMPLEDCTHHRFPPPPSNRRSRWAHVNSIELVDGQIIASFRGCNRILSIDPSTGQVNWRIGPTNLSEAEWESRGKGPAPIEIIGDPQKQFCGQHAAQILPNGNLLMYDNGADCSRNPWTGEEHIRPSRTYSRAVEYFLDFESNEAVYVREHSLYGTKNHIGWAGGNVAPLDNGGWLISWGFDIHLGDGPPPTPPPFSVDVDITEVDPSTGEEVLTLTWDLTGRQHVRATTMPPYALARQPRPLTAELPVSSATSEFHTGPTDRPQVVVAFPRPIVDFDETSPSLSVQGATVESVSPHLVNGEPAYSYVVTLAPDSDGAVTFRLLTGQACSSGGICAADGTMLSRVPAALVIRRHMTVVPRPIIVPRPIVPVVPIVPIIPVVPVVPVVTIAPVADVTEGTYAEFTLQRGASTDLPLTVSVQVTATGSTLAGSTPTRVTFGAGETSAELRVATLDDTVIEDVGSVTALVLGGTTDPPAYLTDPNNAATVYVADNDVTMFTIVPTTGEVAEGGSITITVQAVGVTFAQPQSIALTLSGTATADGDFQVLDTRGTEITSSRSMTLPAGSSSAQVTIATMRDPDEDEGETIDISFAHDNKTIGQSTITITSSPGHGGAGGPAVVVEIEGASFAVPDTETVFTAAVSDDTRIGSLSWIVTGPDGFTATSNAQRFSFGAPAGGTYTVSATVDDIARRTLTGSVTLTVFGDITDQPFVNEILWLAESGITRGCAAYDYCPSNPVTRAQMASFIARALDLEAPRQRAGFDDVDPSSTHAANIEALYAAQITTGCTRDPLAFCPSNPVTRAQMASFLARALNLDTPGQQAGFTDVDPTSTHAANIEALYAAQITTGCTRDPLAFCPNDAVTRAQMAAFLYRARGEL